MIKGTLNTRYIWDIIAIYWEIIKFAKKSRSAADKLSFENLSVENKYLVTIVFICQFSVRRSIHT